MTASDIIRAWKDAGYRAGLSAIQRAQLPAHPAGAIELPEPTLHAARPTYGFRVKSGLRAGLAHTSVVPTHCSATL
jgi:mersacidin/lichenicidin family type 2 lantibiotic